VINFQTPGWSYYTHSFSKDSKNKENHEKIDIQQEISTILNNLINKKVEFKEKNVKNFIFEKISRIQIDLESLFPYSLLICIPFIFLFFSFFYSPPTIRTNIQNKNKKN
jgi:hypothetical protein